MLARHRRTTTTVLLLAGVLVAAGTAVPATATATSTGKVGSFSVPDGVLHEPSGLAESWRNPGRLYVSSEAEYGTFVAIDAANASVVAQLSIANATSILFDWEDTAVGPCPTGSCIYAGDIGGAKAGASMPADFEVIRIPEPTLPGAGGSLTVTGDRFRFRYPDAPHNAEALIVDPTSAQIYVITKATNGVSGVFAFPVPLPQPSATSVSTLRKVGNVVIPAWPGDPSNAHATQWYPQVTGGTAIPGCNAVLLRTPYAVFRLTAPTGGTFESAFAAKPVSVAAPSGEPQGEAISASRTSAEYYSLSESAAPPFTLNYIDLPGCGG